MLCADLFFLLFGVFLVQLKDLRNSDNYYGKQLVTDSVYNSLALVTDLPIEKNKFIKCQLSIVGLKDKSTFEHVKGQCLAYFKKSELSRKIKSGQLLLIKSRFSEIEAPKNPFEFNYKNYLQSKQVYHTLFVDSNSFQFVNGSVHLNWLWKLGLNCKEFILTQLRNSALSPEAFAICAALITGYDDEIDKTVMDAFAHSGTLHVLSVSGLHTGLIYILLNFLGDLVDKKRKYKLSRFILITCFLWFFALITGFSAPVLRAVIMFNLLGAGNLFFRNHLKNQINILFFSAFILLVYNPFYIEDIGFLLSYLAVFGLLYFQPKMATLWKPEHKMVSYIWQSLCISFAATLSTLPITLYYFKQFPIWFFLCNLVVVPATFLILILAMFVLLKLKPIAVIINYLVSGLIWLIQLFNQKQIGYIDQIHFTKTDALFLTCLLILLSLFIESKSYKHLKTSFLVLICWQCFSIFDSFKTKQKNLLSVYQLKKESAISLKNKQSVFIYQSDTSKFNFSVKPHLISFNYPSIQPSVFNFINTSSGSILILHDNRSWPIGDFKEVSHLILLSDFNLSEKALKAFPKLKMIVVDGSNNRYTTAATEKLSRNFGIDFYNTKLSGAFIMSLP